jgi:hypothetical protein
MNKLQLMVNNAGRWRCLMDFDATTKPEVMDAAERLGEQAASADCRLAFAVVQDMGRGPGDMHDMWTYEKGWHRPEIPLVRRGTVRIRTGAQGQEQQCCTCGTWKLATEDNFHKNPRATNLPGLRPHCKPCMKAHDVLRYRNTRKNSRAGALWQLETRRQPSQPQPVSA